MIRQTEPSSSTGFPRDQPTPSMFSATQSTSISEQRKGLEHSNNRRQLIQPFKDLQKTNRHENPQYECKKHALNWIIYILENKKIGITSEADLRKYILDDIKERPIKERAEFDLNKIVRNIQTHLGAQIENLYRESKMMQNHLAGLIRLHLDPAFILSFSAKYSSSTQINREIIEALKSQKNLKFPHLIYTILQSRRFDILGLFITVGTNLDYIPNADEIKQNVYFKAYAGKTLLEAYFSDDSKAGELRERGQQEELFLTMLIKNGAKGKNANEIFKNAVLKIGHIYPNIIQLLIKNDFTVGMSVDELGNILEQTFKQEDNLDLESKSHLEKTRSLLTAEIDEINADDDSSDDDDEKSDAQSAAIPMTPAIPIAPALLAIPMASTIQNVHEKIMALLYRKREQIKNDLKGNEDALTYALQNNNNNLTNLKNFQSNMSVSLNIFLNMIAWLENNEKAQIQCIEDIPPFENNVSFIPHLNQFESNFLEELRSIFSNTDEDDAHVKNPIIDMLNAKNKELDALANTVEDKNSTTYLNIITVKVGIAILLIEISKNPQIKIKNFDDLIALRPKFFNFNNRINLFRTIERKFFDDLFKMSQDSTIQQRWQRI